MKKIEKTIKKEIEFVTDFFEKKPSNKFETVLFVENKDRELLLGLLVGDLSFDDFQHFIIATGNSLATGSLLDKIDPVHTTSLVSTMWYKKKDEIYNLYKKEEKGTKECILVSMMNSEKKGIYYVYKITRGKEKTTIKFNGEVKSGFFDLDNEFFWDSYNSTKEIWKELDEETKLMAETMSLGVIRSLLERHI